MNLAKDKHGRIGRKEAKPGFDASVIVPESAEEYGSVYLSPRALEIEEKRREKEEAWKIAQAKARRVEQIAKREGQRLIEKKQRFEIEKEQAKKRNLKGDALRAYFSRQMGESEEMKTAKSLVANPNFSQEGWNPEIIPGADEYKNVWRADFRQEKVVGNPISSNGIFGEGSSDFEKIVKGEDVDQWNKVKVVGGTMLGRVNDQDIPRATMGFDFSWDSISSGFENLADKTWGQLQEQLPGQLARELQEELFNQGGSPGTQTVVVNRPVYQPVQAAAQSLGVPPWAIYAGVGMIGVGLLVILLKK